MGVRRRLHGTAPLARSARASTSDSPGASGRNTKARGRQRFLGVLASAALALAASGSAQASGYWNVWQGNLPDASGDRSKHSSYFGAGQTWWVRMSWTADSHDMNFSYILSSGSWRNVNSAHGVVWTGPWDRLYGWDGYAKGGCQNPAGKPTVWVNCRHAETW